MKEERENSILNNRIKLAVKFSLFVSQPLSYGLVTI